MPERAGDALEGWYWARDWHRGAADADRPQRPDVPLVIDGVDFGHSHEDEPEPSCEQD